MISKCTRKIKSSNSGFYGNNNMVLKGEQHKIKSRVIFFFRLKTVIITHKFICKCFVLHGFHNNLAYQKLQHVFFIGLEKHIVNV